MDDTRDVNLPVDLGGYQRLAPEEITQSGDIGVYDGVPDFFVAPKFYVKDYESASKCTIYRKLAVAKPGDLDHLPSQYLPDWQASALPADAKARKQIPLASGLLDYFPLALIEVAKLSAIGNEQHNPGAPLHWDRSKSGDEADALMRHLLERDKVDTDGVLHAVKVAWRGLALAQKKLESLQRPTA